MCPKIVHGPVYGHFRTGTRGAQRRIISTRLTNKNHHMKRLPTSVLVCLLLATACTRYVPGRHPGPAPTRSASTRDGYEDELARNNLNASAAYAEWSGVARRALRDRLTIRPSFREILLFSPECAAAVGYRLELRRGQRVRVDLERGTRARIFAEVFEEIGGNDPVFRLVQTASSKASVIDFEATADGPHVIRIQPEMSQGGEVTVTVTTTAALTFPVSGQTSRAIGSQFGDERDGGKRDHEGIDIMAPAGTDVVAAAAGIITNVSTTALGGKVVWQQDLERNVLYYYAHLNSQNVERGDRVAAGDVVGTVGNTGNAKHTPPHLHFAVYKPGRVPINPVPFLFDQPSNPVEPVRVDLNALGTYRELKPGRIVMRLEPDAQGATVAAVARADDVFVIGGVRDWYRVMLSDGRTGFVRARDLGGPYSVKAAR